MIARMTNLLLASFAGSMLLLTASGLAQETQAARDIAARKLDAHLRILLNAPHAPIPLSDREDEADMIHIFVRGDAARAAAAIGRAGGRVGSSLGNILTATVPRAGVMGIALDPAIERIEASARLAPSDDSLTAAVGADRAHAGEHPLPQEYTGTGVIVGIIDTGIDIDHLEFRRRSDTGTSRFISIWSQKNTSGAPPQGFDYGTEWDRSALEQAIRGADMSINREELSGGVHGTHVASIAAGVHGIAPDADIIFVQPIDFPDQSAFASSVIDGARYIFEKARSLGRPCVINLSMSDIQNAHDGSDLFSQALDQLIADGSGRVFCASAGNNGSRMQHWGSFDVESDSVWTYLYAADSWYLRIPDSSLAALQISIAADSGLSSEKFVGQTPWRTVAAIGAAPGGFVTDTIYYDKARRNLAGMITIATTPLGNGHSELLIDPYFRNFDRLRLNARGGGTFHMWTTAFVPPDAIRFSGWKLDDRYRVADSLFNIGRPAIANNVIAVGSSINRTTFVDIRGRTQMNTSHGVSGALSSFSSRGPALDGRVKPDIVAPGELVIAARSRYVDQPDYTWLADTTMIVLSGTSMSTPATVGAIALYLQKNPSADFREVRSTIIATARQDAFTASHGPLPNGHWGNGKLDIFAALARGESGVAVGAGANGRSNVPYVVTNTATGAPEIRMNLTKPAEVEFTLSDLTGSTVLQQKLGRLEPGSHTLPLEPDHLAQGAYVYRITIGRTAHAGMVPVTR